MEKFSGVLLITRVLTCILFVCALFFASLANSFEDIEQQRDLCLQDCHEQFATDDPGLWQLSAQCIDRCEKTYWKKWNRQMNNIGDD